jgi:hypothetical protein
VLPVFIGWGIAFAAARQRLAVTWPIISMIAVAVVGAGLVFTADWPVTPRHWSVRISTPLSDPTLSMSWAEYASSVWGTLTCILLPAWFAFWKTGCSPWVERGRECV